jgi:hypothetical protein
MIDHESTAVSERCCGTNVGKTQFFTNRMATTEEDEIRTVGIAHEFLFFTG